MKQILKNTVYVVIGTVLICAMTVLFFRACDSEYENQMRKDFESYNKFEPESITSEYLESIRSRMPEDFKFADWGYPEFDN